MLLAKSRPIVVIFIADGSHFARERLMAFTPWHLDAVSGSHPPHLLIGCKVENRPAPKTSGKLVIELLSGRHHCGWSGRSRAGHPHDGVIAVIARTRHGRNIVRRPKATPIHELEHYMRCNLCS